MGRQTAGDPVSPTSPAGEADLVDETNSPTEAPLVSAALVEELFAPLRLRNAAEHVADRLVTAIALGEFVLGQRLPSERDLAATLAVSRTTIREAISRLAATGYVEVRRGRHGGAFVTSGTGPDADEMIRRTLVPGWAQLERLFDFRALVEPLIARTAAERRTPAEASRIRDAVAAYRAAGDDRDASSRADGEVHRAIAEAARNPYLVDLSDRIRHAVSLGFRAEPYSPAIRERAVIEHGELADAVIAGEPGRAAAIAGHHFSITEERLRTLYERARALEPPTDVAG
jgi:GntR family transcriptional regulator, transcriptional repressor for pyruvate dehydrogenase complex